MVELLEEKCREAPDRINVLISSLSYGTCRINCVVTSDVLFRSSDYAQLSPVAVIDFGFSF